MASCIIFGYVQDSSQEKTEITLYESIIDLDTFINEVKTHNYFKDHNDTTVEWLEGIGNNYMVIPGEDGYYIMQKTESDKIPMEFATDVSIKYICEAHIDDKRPLSDDLGDVMMVSNLEFIRENITYYDV